LDNARGYLKPTAARNAFTIIITIRNVANAAHASRLRAPLTSCVDVTRSVAPILRATRYPKKKTRSLIGTNRRVSRLTSGNARFSNRRTISRFIRIPRNARPRCLRDDTNSTENAYGRTKLKRHAFRQQTVSPNAIVFTYASLRHFLEPVIFTRAVRERCITFDATFPSSPPPTLTKYFPILRVNDSVSWYTHTT